VFFYLFATKDIGFVRGEKIDTRALSELIRRNSLALLGAFGGMDGSGYANMPLFNIAMENGPFIDGLPGFTY